MALETTVLEWQRNGSRIETFTVVSDEPGEFQQQSFTLFLDMISRRDSVANMTSRLVFELYNVRSGDQITCEVAPGGQRSTILNYIRKCKQDF